VQPFSSCIPLNAYGLPDPNAVPTPMHRVHAQVVFPARLSPHDRDRVVNAVRHVLDCAGNAWDATVQLDRLLKRSGGRSRLAVEVTFTDIEVPVGATSSARIRFTPTGE